MEKKIEANIMLLSAGLTEKNGIWYPASISPISYPTEGNASSMLVEDSSYWFRHRNNCISTLVKKFASNKIFWDIGGGNGFVSKGLQTEGISTILLEPGEQGALEAYKRGVKNVICSTFEDSNLNPNAIEAAGLFDVIEHIEDDEGFLRKLSLTMAPKGNVFISVPAYNFLSSKDDDYAGHFRRYTLSSLNKTLRNAGFEPVYNTYIFSILVIPVLFFRTLPSKLGLLGDPSSKAKIKSDHNANRFVNSILDGFWKTELNQIKSGKSIPFGGSCLMVAQKK